MENYREWNPVDDLEDTNALLRSGAVPDETAYSLEDILKEYGTEEKPVAAESREQAQTAPESGTEPEAAPEEPESAGEPAPSEDGETAEVEAAEPKEDFEPEAPSIPEAEEEAEPAVLEPMDVNETAAFIGQQVNDAIGGDSEEEPGGDTTINGLREFFLEARRKTADRRLRREQQRREREAAAALAAAAAAVAEEKSEAEQATPEDGNVVEMPASIAKPFRDRFGAIQDKLNSFADSMYSEAGTPEQDSSREFVPGTDTEEEPQKKFWRERRPRKQRPKAPDVPAEELAARYRLGLRFMRQRLFGLFFLALVLLYISVAEDCALPLPGLLLDHQATSGVLTWGLALGAAVGLDIMWLGLSAPMRGKPGMHTLTALAVLVTLADGLYATLVGRDGPLPFAAMAMFSLFGAALGAYQRKRGLFMSCRTAAGAAEPYRVTLDENKWNGVSAFSKETGTAKGFGSQIQSMDGAERIYRIWVPLLGLAAAVCAVVASVGRGRPGMLTWCLSTIFVSAAPIAGLMAFGQPYLRLTRRLDRSGTVLAGWDGVESMTGKANILIKDEDLFPEESIIMKSIKHFEGVSLEKLTGCTASMLRAAGSGLYHLFDAELRRQGGFYRWVDSLECYEAGGLTADIRGDQVLVGTHGFLTVMNIKLEEGMKVRRAVYCVINKKLEGIFTLDYEMSHYAKEAIEALVKGGVQPVLVTRDFNVIPSMLQNLHELPVERMEYPPIERRRELSEPGQEHNPVLGALLTREGMGAYSDAIIGGRRLYTVVRLNAIIAVLSSLVGVALSFYLTWSLAFASLTPLSMMAFLVIWMIPNLAISGAVDRF